MTTTLDDRVFFTIEEFARVFAVSRRTVQRWIATGRLKALRTHPTRQGVVRIHRSEMDRLVAEATS